MTPIDFLITEALGGLDVCSTGYNPVDRKVDAVVSALSAPHNREAVVAWLVEAGVISEAEVWLPPDEITDEMIEAARQRRDHAAAQAESGSEFGVENWQQASDDLFALRAARGRYKPYSTEEHVPPGAVPLYRVNRGES